MNGLTQGCVGGPGRCARPQVLEDLITRQAVGGGDKKQDQERAGRAAWPRPVGNEQASDFESEGSEQVSPELWRVSDGRCVHGLKAAFRQEDGPEIRGRLWRPHADHHILRCVGKHVNQRPPAISPRRPVISVCTGITGRHAVVAL